MASSINGIIDSRVGLGMVMGTMNASMEAAMSGIGGWFDGVSYMAGLSGGSWGTGTFMANGGPLPSNLITTVSIFGLSKITMEVRLMNILVVGSGLEFDPS